TLATSSTTTTADITAVSLSLSAPTASNKTYDQSASASLSNQGSLSGILSGDDVSLTGGSASFADANVGAGKTVTFSGYSLTGDEAANYTLSTASTTTTADITARTLTISAPTISDKIYDGNQNASVTAGSLNGLLGNEQLGVSATGQFGDSDAGSSKYVSVSYSLSNGANGGRAANYSLSDGSGSASITPKSLSISGSSVASKDYDGGTNAAVTAGTISGMVSTETLQLSATGSFADKNAGQNKQVSVSYSLSDGNNGGKASNYQLAQEQLSADITAKTLTISAPTVSNKIYDGTQSATVQAGSLNGLVGNETLGVSASGSFDDVNAGNGKSVSVSYMLADGTNGGLASNYSLNGGSASANISARTLTLPNLSIADKIYDGTRTATLTSFGSFGNLVGGDDVELDSTAAASSFANANAGLNKSVAITGLALIGGDSTNYQLGAVSGAASITPKSLTISGSSAKSKRYDGTRNAEIEAGTLSGFISNESLELEATGLFDSASGGKAKRVLVSYQLLDGLNNGLAMNYKLDDEMLFADIEGAAKKSEDLRFTRLMDKEIIEVKEEMGSAYKVMVEKLETELVELADAAIENDVAVLNAPQEGIVDAMGSWSMLSCDISQGMAGYCGAK
ncbi:MAG: YDG domain-containing protein, partial [Candidatus Puniceispirillaceae bacterium]